MAASPAAVAGVQVGDIIQGFAHESVSDYRAFNRAVMMSVGKTMKVRVWRKGETRVLSMRVKEWPQEVWESYKSGASRESLFTKLADYGFEISDVNDDLRSRFKLDPQIRGPIVTSVTEDTAASGAKLKPGDVVLTVQMEEVLSREDFERRLADLCSGGQRNALLFVKGANGPRWLTLPLRL
jgi:serine protease Do